jgi:putative endonuclease
MKQYFVYIMTDRKQTLCVGVTNDLARRVYEHKHKLMNGFASRYAIDHLVYFEECNDVRAAIGREKQLKRWLRARKVTLIESVDSRWQDLSRGGLESAEGSLRVDSSASPQDDRQNRPSAGV